MKKLLLFSALMLTTICNAQILAIKGNILLNSKPTTDPIFVTVIETTDTMETFSQTYRAEGQFDCLLIDNRNYLFIFERVGYQPKCITVSTHAKTNKKFNYEFSVNLTNYDKINDTPKYTGGIYFDRKKKTFDYFLTHK